MCNQIQFTETNRLNITIDSILTKDSSVGICITQTEKGWEVKTVGEKKKPLIEKFGLWIRQMKKRPAGTERFSL
jgi:hypothetical protein